MSTPPHGGNQPPSNWQPAQQPGPYGQQPPQGPTGPQGQPGPYGQQLPQGQPGAHGQPAPYGQPGAHGQPGAYGQPSAYGQPGAYGQQMPQGQPGPHGQPQQQKSSRKPLVIGGAIAAAAALGVGAWAIAQGLGGGATGEMAEALPAESYGYVELDMSMTAGEQIKAARFYEQLPPEVKQSFEDGDPRRAVVEELMLGEQASAVDYEQDIEPWLGDSMAIGAMPGEGEPMYVLVLDTSNSNRAEKALQDPQLAAAMFGGTSNWFMHNGYVVSGQDDATNASAATGLESGASLHDSGTFTEDMNRVGDKGIMSVWVNGQYVEDQNAADPYATTTPYGSVDDVVPELGADDRAAMTLRIEADHLELDAHSIGTTGDMARQTPVGERTSAPEGVALSMHATGVGEVVREGWSEILASDPGTQDTADLLEDYFDLSLPDDLVTLAGDSTSFVVHDIDPNAISATGELPGISMRGYGETGAMESAATGFENVAQDLVGTELPTASAADGLVIGTTEEAVQAHAAAATTAGDSAAQALLENPADANLVVQADLDQWEPLYMDELRASSEHHQWAPLVESFSQVGLTSQVVDEESSRTVVRLN